MTPKNQQRTPQKLQLKDFQEFHQNRLEKEKF
jgi:ribosomal protein L33